LNGAPLAEVDGVAAVVVPVSVEHDTSVNAAAAPTSRADDFFGTLRLDWVLATVISFRSG
jgi:hypothetical protein